MLSQSRGKIFLADERGYSEMEWYRSYNTFNFGNFFNPHKTAFESLYVWNDDTLAGGKRIRMDVEEQSDILLIPVVGTIAFKDQTGHTGFVEAGQVQLLTLPAGAYFEIANPYEEDLINFLHIWIRRHEQEVEISEFGCSISDFHSFHFNLETNKNRLIDILNPLAIVPQALPYKALIGKFDGRAEAIYKKANECNALFAFAIQGELEVQYRLLHARDGLALWDIDEIEMEALSNDAIILILEIPRV